MTRVGKKKQGKGVLRQAGAKRKKHWTKTLRQTDETEIRLRLHLCSSPFTRSKVKEGCIAHRQPGRRITAMPSRSPKRHTSSRPNERQRRDTLPNMSHTAAAAFLFAREASRCGRTAAAAGWRRWCGGGSTSASSAAGWRRRCAGGSTSASADDANSEHDVSSDSAAAVASSLFLRWGSPPAQMSAGRRRDGGGGGGNSRFAHTATVPTPAEEVRRKNVVFFRVRGAAGSRVVNMQRVRVAR